MPTQYIQIYDRQTYQTEKVKGFDRVRMFKGSATTSPSNNASESELITVLSGQYVFDRFKTIQSNYKGSNFIANSSALEGFDSFVLKANGVAYYSDDAFNFRFDLLDDTNNPISGARVDTNYSIGLTAPLPSGGIDWFDWYIEVEFTFYRDGSDNILVVNGNLTYADKGNVNNCKIIAICGVMNTGGAPSFSIDFAPTYAVPGASQNVGIKSVSLEFIE